MKRAFILGFSLVTLGINQLSVLAQLSNAGIKKYMNKFEHNIKLYEQTKNPLSPPKDNRTQSEKQQRKALVRAWSKEEPILSSFLGLWTEMDINILIYPSNIKNQVCMITAGEGTASFYIGYLFHGAIKTKAIIDNEGNTSNGNKIERILLNKKEYLQTLNFKNGKLQNEDSTFLNSPKSLPKVNNIFLYNLKQEERRSIIHEFVKYKCSDSIPRK